MAMSRGEHAIVKARSGLLINDPFYGCLALMLQLQEIPEDNPFCKTMAVDGKRMFYYEKFVLSLSEEHLLFVVAHEVSHCAYQHMTRRGHRDPGRWNRAGDFVINQDLVDAGFKMLTEWKDPVTGAIKRPCFDPKYKGWSTEEVYEDLTKNEPTITITLIADGGEGEGAKGPDGQPMPSDDDGGFGMVIDVAGAGTMSKAEVEQTVRDWQENVRTAISAAKANGAGKIPGNLKRLVEQLEEPKIDWREVTRDFIDRAMSMDFSWARPNRRHIHAGRHFPGSVPDRLHHLVVFADCSGSISEKLLIAMLSECGGMLDQGACIKITVIYIDTEVRHVDVFNAGDQVQASVVAGGGTAFHEGFAWVKEHEPDAAAIVFLTDMCTSSWGEEPECPVLWAAYGRQETIDQYVPPFGTVLHVDSAEI